MSAGAASPITAFPPVRSLALRRRQRMEAWKRRSRLIRRLRRALPAAVIGILILMAAWVAVHGFISRFVDLRLGGGAIHMTNAHFYGRDGQGRAYVLGATEAVRDDADPHRIQLHNLLLAVDAGGPRESHISADGGVYRDDSKILLLQGHVSLRDPSGDNLKTDKAIVDTAHGAIAGQGRVWGWGPMGTIEAQTFSVYDQGQRIVFRGEVHSIMKGR